MKTDKLLHLLQQKKFMRSGGALPLPKAQDGTITDPFIGMRKFYDDAYNALDKYENKQGEVSPFNVNRAWAKAAIKNPHLLFRDRHSLSEQGFSEDQITSAAENPYHKDSPVIRMSDTETKHQYPTDYVVPNEKDVERYNRYIANQTQQKSSKGNGFDLSDEWRDIKKGVRNISRDVRHFIGKEIPRALRNCVNGDCYEFHQQGGLAKAQKGIPTDQYTRDYPPIYVTDPNDPRLKSYNDSLALYKNYKKPPLGYIPISQSNSAAAKDFKQSYSRRKEDTKGFYYSPNGSSSGNEAIVYYGVPPKKPVQPVELNKVKHPLTQGGYNPMPIFDLMMPDGNRMKKDDFINNYGEAAWLKATRQKYQTGGGLSDQLFQKYYGQVAATDRDKDGNDLQGYDYFYSQVPELQALNPTDRSILIDRLMNFMQHPLNPNVAVNPNELNYSNLYTTPQEIDKSIRQDNYKLKLNKNLTPKQPVVYDEYQTGGLAKAQKGIPNPFMPGKTLATGAIEKTMSPIDVAIAAISGVGLVPSAIKLTKSIANSGAESHQIPWLQSMAAISQAQIANTIRDTYEKVTDKKVGGLAKAQVGSSVDFRVGPTVAKAKSLAQQTPFPVTLPNTAVQYINFQDNRVMDPVVKGKKIESTRRNNIDNVERDKINKIIEQAKVVGVDPATLLTNIIWETRAGETDDNWGHNLYDETPTIEGLDSNSEKANIAAQGLLRQLNLGKKKYPQGPSYKQLQAYQGYGPLYPDTEKRYYKTENQAFYGIPVTKEKPLLTNKLFPYGKTIEQFRDSVVRPTLDKYGINYQKGGPLPKAQIGWFEKLTSTLNPYNWGVEDYSKEKDFTKAYSTAKKAGEEEFMYKNKRYNTKYAGTPRQEVGTYGVDGKPVHPMDLNHPAQVNLYPAFGKYLPGHISASVGDNKTSIDYSSIGNFPFGIEKVENKGEKSFNVYGQDDLTFSNKAASLPTGDYMIEDKFTPSDWNLFTNNCADNVCDVFGIPRRKGIETPANALSKIKEKYSTIDVTGRTYEDYQNLYKELQNQPNKKILSQANNILGIASSPEIQESGLSNKLISTIQGVLDDEGFAPSKSQKESGGYDGIYGPETKKALEDWQKKNKSLAMGGQLLPKAQNGKASNFLQPNNSKLKEGYNIPSRYPSTELATSIGGEDGEPAYLIPSFKYGHILRNPGDEFYNTGDYIGGPFKTWQEADKWDIEVRHPYVEKGQPIPSPLKWWGEGYRQGGSLPKAQVGIPSVATANQQAIQNAGTPYLNRTMVQAIFANASQPVTNTLGKVVSTSASREKERREKIIAKNPAKYSIEDYKLGIQEPGADNSVLADPIAMAAALTAGGVGLGATALSQVPRMFLGNLASEATAGMSDIGKGLLKKLSRQRPGSTLSEPIFSSDFYESKRKLDEVRQQYIDAINQKAQPKSLDDITKDVDALNKTIVPRSEATTEDLQSLLEGLQNINKDLEKHIPKKLVSGELGNLDDLSKFEKVGNNYDSRLATYLYEGNIPLDPFYKNRTLSNIQSGSSPVWDFNQQLNQLRSQMQFGTQPLEKPLFRPDITKSIQDNLAEEALFKNKFIQEQMLKDDLLKKIEYDGKPVIWSPRASEYKIKMKDFKPFGGIEAWRQGLYPNKQGGSIMNSYQKGGGIKDMVVSEIWEKVTGTKWSQAKKLGLSDGSYDTNIKLRQMLINEAMQSKPNFGKFVGKTSYVVPASSAMVNQLRQEGLAQANIPRDKTGVARPMMPPVVGRVAPKAPSKSVPLPKVEIPTNQTAPAGTSAVSRPAMAPVVGRAQSPAPRSVVTQPVVMPTNVTAPASTTAVRQPVVRLTSGPLQQQAEIPRLVTVTPPIGQPTYPKKAEKSGSMFPNLSGMTTASMLNMLPVVGGVQAANAYGPMFAGNAARSVADQSLQQLPSFVGNYLRGNLLNLPPVLTEDEKKEVAYAINQGELQGYGVPKKWEKKGFTGSAGYDEFRSGRDPLNAFSGLTDISYWGDDKAMNRFKRIYETNWDAANAMLSLGKFNFKKNPDGSYTIGDQYNFEEYPYQANPSNILEYMENPNIQVTPSEMNIPAEYFTKQKKKGGSKKSLKIKIRKK